MLQHDGLQDLSYAGTAVADVEHMTWVANLVHGRDSSVVGGLVLHSITPVGASRELAPSWDDGRPPCSQGSQQTCTNAQHTSLQCQWHPTGVV